MKRLFTIILAIFLLASCGGSQDIGGYSDEHGNYKEVCCEVIAIENCSCSYSRGRYDKYTVVWDGHYAKHYFVAERGLYKVGDKLYFAKKDPVGPAEGE